MKPCAPPKICGVGARASGSSGGVVDRAPDVFRRRRHLLMVHAQRVQRIDDGVHHGRQRADRAIGLARQIDIVNIPPPPHKQPRILTPRYQLPNRKFTRGMTLPVFVGRMIAVWVRADNVGWGGILSKVIEG